MKVRNLMLAGAFALMGILSACNENPVDEPGNAPGNIRASSKSSTEVTIAWDAVAGATSYDLSWQAVAPASGAGSKTGITTLSEIVDGLSEGTTYTFTVTATTASRTGTAASIQWSPSSRPTLTGDSKPIRMYEFASSSPSGLNLDVAGAPMQVSMVLGTVNKAQLAMFVYDNTPATTDIDSLIIGPAYAMIEYRAAHDASFSKIDTSVYISSTTSDVASLNSWFLKVPLNGLIDNQSNVKAYTIKSNNSIGQGFIVRTGALGAYHYARVVIKAVGGLLVTGGSPNRYIDLEVSYQNGIGVPFAKAGMPEAPVGVTATRVTKRVIM